MKTKPQSRKLIILINLLLLSFAFSIQAQDSQCTFLPSSLLRDIAPAIVKLRVVPDSQGSGVIVSPSGIIITAAHVVQDAGRIEVDTILSANESPRFRYVAEVISLNEDYDFALLQIIQNANNISVRDLDLVSVSASETLITIGDCITIMGYPLEANSTLVPSDGRTGQSTSWAFRANGERVQVFATNAEISQGQSGGAVLDSLGFLRGIVVETRGQQFSFIIPMSEICLLEVSICNIVSQVQVSIPGSFQSEVGCGGDWMPECNLTRLYDYGNSGVYRWSTNDIPAGDYEVKVAINGTWDENYGEDGIRDGANIPFTVPSNGALVVFSYNPEFHILTVSAQSERRLVTAPGDFQSEIGCPEYMGYYGDWAPECLLSRLQDLDGDGTYTWITTDIPAGLWEVKIAINGSWDENYGANGEPAGENIPFEVRRAGSQVTFSYNSRTNRLTITTQ